jgi:hypothetical protein
MKKTKLLVFICALTVSQTHADKILCKKGFCPIVSNMSINGTALSYDDGAWTVTGPWGGGGAPIIINGNHRCSETKGTYLNTGSPVEDAGQYCWCQMKSEDSSGSWVFQSDQKTHCDANCKVNCANYVQSKSNFRAAACVSVSDSCNRTTVSAENDCPSGYVRCTKTRYYNMRLIPSTKL